MASGEQDLKVRESMPNHLTRNLSELFVRPLFYEALCGEYKSNADEMNRIHSLGRLAMDAFAMGDLTEQNNRASFKLRPSWAYHIEFAIGCSYNPNEQAPYILEHIELRNAHDEEMGVMDITTRKPNTVLLWQPEYHNGGVPNTELRIGFGQTNDERNLIALAANLFINQAQLF